MILNDLEALDVVKKNNKPSNYILQSRKMAKELFALIEGKDFKNVLINKIEHLESDLKAQARIKYSRSITDFFKRLLHPVNNIYSSVGGSKVYEIENENLKKDFLKKLSTSNGNTSLEKWLKQIWMPLYHADPNGVIMWEHKDDYAYPTYKCIDAIRAYEVRGQNVEWILFEPEKVDHNGTNVMMYRLVDDSMDRIFYQIGNDIVYSEDNSFENQFGKVPAVVNSDLMKVGEDIRVSPVDSIIGLCKELLRDQSIKTIYKFQNGFPIHWRYVSQCRTCRGTGKTGEGICGDCSGKGYIQKGDVTDMVTLPIPESDDPVLAPNIAGFISPDIETWEQFNTELQFLEELAYRTHWNITATNNSDGQAETATGRYIDLQPQINKLNDYADTAEWVESQMSEFLLRFLDQTEAREDSRVYVNYGRRYILESADTILEKYHTAKDNNDSVVILDRLLNEFITAKYKNDPKQLRVNLSKILVEPYVHNNIDDIQRMFGNKEALRKIWFGKWWELEADYEKDIDTLIEEYKEFFNNKYEIYVKESEVSSPIQAGGSGEA